MDFCVVEFQESRDMLVVHTSWLVGESQSYCPPYWASSSKLKKAVTKGESPNEETWALHTARILKRSGSYEHALKMLKEAETANTSEIGLDRPLGRGCRRAAVRRLSESSSSSETEVKTRNLTPKKRRKVAARVGDSHTLPAPPPPPAAPMTQQVLPRVLDTEPSFTFGPLLLGEPAVEIHEETQAAMVGALRVDSPMSSVTSGMSPISSTYRDTDMTQTLRSGTIKQVLLQLSVMNAKLDAQGEMLAIIMRSNEKTAILDDNPCPYTLPVETLAAFEALESLIKSESTEKVKLIQKLGTAGGSTANDTTYRSMARLMTNEVALEHSWAGLKGKIPVEGLVVMTAVCEAVKRNPLAKYPTDLEVETAIKYWLKRASSRILAAQVAANKKKSSI